MSGALKGFCLAIVNTLFIAVGLAIAMENGPVHVLRAMVLVGIIGGIPGVIAGLCLGHMADVLALHLTGPAARYRFPILAVGGCFVVLVLGLLAGAPLYLIAASCVPTAAGCSILERWTRPAPPPFPAAQVVR